MGRAKKVAEKGEGYKAARSKKVPCAIARAIQTDYFVVTRKA